MREILRAKLGLPFALDLAEHLQSLCPRGVSALGKADNARAALIRRVGPDQISEIFQTPEQAVHGLLAHPCALGQNAGANSVGAWESEYRYVRQAKPLEARRIQVADDAPVNGLGREHAASRR